MSKTRISGRTLFFLSALTIAAAAQAKAPPAPKGDAVHGQAIFNQCKICHSIDAGKNMIGPSLHDVVGRKAGTAAGFTYSPAMKNSAITWTPQQLSDFLTAPMKKVSGTRMTFAGLPNQKDRDDVIAYLAKN